MSKNTNVSDAILTSKHNDQAEYEAALETWKTIAFQPVTYRVEIKGECKKVSVGNISNDAYEYWKTGTNANGDKLEDLYDGDGLNIPDYARIFPDNDWYELCDVYSMFAALPYDSVIEVYDQDGTLVLESSLDIDDLAINGLQCNVNNEADSLLVSGEPVFIGHQPESGLYFQGYIHLYAPFKASNLRLVYDSFQGEQLFFDVFYRDVAVEMDHTNTHTGDADFKVLIP